MAVTVPTPVTLGTLLMERGHLPDPLTRLLKGQVQGALAWSSITQ